MKLCPACGEENGDEAARCAGCARPLPPSPRRAPAVQPRPPDLTPTPLPPVSAPEPTMTMTAAPVAVAPEHAVLPLPETPDSGLFQYARYAVAFARARRSRRVAIRELGEEIQERVSALDAVLGTLGERVRRQKLTMPVLAEENRAIDGAEHRRIVAERSVGEAEAKIADENTRFEATEKDLEAKLAAAETAAVTAADELAKLESERSVARERKKDVDKQQRSYLKGAERREAQAAKAELGDQRNALQRSAEDLRADAARLEPEREALEKKLLALEGPYRDAEGRAEATRADRDALRRTLEDSRTGHRHRQTELEAERGHHAHEAADATAEIGRRRVTLGTIANLNRVGDPAFAPLYEQVDALRAAISAREQEIERLEAERRQFDPGALTRGAAVLGGAVVLLITVVSVVVALLR